LGFLSFAPANKLKRALGLDRRNQRPNSQWLIANSRNAAWA
jgi:hypothetical protein